MSSENNYLALRLQGPLQSWGFDSQYNRRNTGLMPTKSALAGMCCAALGFGRGSDEEQAFLAKFADSANNDHRRSSRGRTNFTAPPEK